MNNKAFKYIKYLSYILLGLGVAVFVYFIVSSLMSPEPSTEYSVGSEGAARGVDVMLIYAYIVFGIALLLALVFPLVNIVSNPKGAGRTLIGLAVLIVVCGVSYLLASDAPVPNPAGGVNSFFSNATTLKLTDVGLYTAYAALAAAFIVIIYGEVRGAFISGKK